MNPKRRKYLALSIAAILFLLGLCLGTFEMVRDGKGIHAILKVWVLMLIIIALTILFLIILAWRYRRCPNCGKEWVLELTRMNMRGEKELRCKYCGYKVRRVLDS